MICMCNLPYFDDVMELKCMHVFHEECVGTWLKQEKNCPVCKECTV